MYVIAIISLLIACLTAGYVSAGNAFGKKLLTLAQHGSPDDYVTYNLESATKRGKWLLPAVFTLLSQLIVVLVFISIAIMVVTIREAHASLRLLFNLLIALLIGLIIKIICSKVLQPHYLGLIRLNISREIKDGGQKAVAFGIVQAQLDANVLDQLKPVRKLAPKDYPADYIFDTAIYDGVKQPLINFEQIVETEISWGNQLVSKLEDNHNGHTSYELRFPIRYHRLQQAIEMPDTVEMKTVEQHWELQYVVQPWVESYTIKCPTY